MEKQRSGTRAWQARGRQLPGLGTQDGGQDPSLFWDCGHRARLSCASLEKLLENTVTGEPGSSPLGIESCLPRGLTLIAVLVVT